MINANRYALWLLAALLFSGAAWYGYWFLTHFEQQSRQVRSGLSPEARSNPFLAAELFLQHNGTAAVSLREREIFRHQPGPRDTLFLGHFSQLFIERNHARLADWVVQGGHLIFVAYEHDNEREPLPLIEELGVELVELDEEAVELHCEDSIEPCRTQDNGSRFAELKQPRRVTLGFHSDTPGRHLARFQADRHLADSTGTATILAGDTWMPHLLQYAMGSGRVTVLSDSDLFSNEHIGEVDHAYLLARLVGDSDKVWLFYSAEMPSLLQRLWRSAPHLTLLLALLLLVAGWRLLGQRCGPLLTSREGERRNLLEHLDASARFSWRIERAQQLLQQNRDSIEQAWCRRHPQLNPLPRQQRCEWIGEKSGLTPRAVERSLYGKINSEQDFIRATSVLQRLATAVRNAS